MKVFRVRDVGHVENHIGWKLMDGVAFVSVGGSNRPYATVAPALLPHGEREGTVTECNILLGDRAGCVVLVPCERRDDLALVIVPSGAFDFRGSPLVSVRDAAWMFVMRSGDKIAAFPKVRTIAEAEAMKAHVLHFDGESVTFTAA